MNSTEVSGRQVVVLVAACAAAFGIALVIGRVFGGFVGNLAGLVLFCGILGWFAVWVSRANDSQPRRAKRPRTLLVVRVIWLSG